MRVTVEGTIGAHAWDGDRHPHTRDVTVRALVLVDNEYGVRETGPDTEANEIRNNHLCGNRGAGIETYADSTEVAGNTACGADGAPLFAGVYPVTCADSGKVLDVTRGSTADGATVQQWGYAGTANRHWRLERVEGGAYRIENVESGEVLEVAGE